MVGRALKSKPHRFVCLTDDVGRLRGTEIDTVRVPKCVGIPGWWSKIELFNPSTFKVGSRIISIDLDVLVRSLSGIADIKSDKLSLVPPAGSFQGRDGLQVIKRYNSSVMAWTACERLSKLYKMWTPAFAQRLWGDQDYIGQMLPYEDTMPLEWFPRISEMDCASGEPDWGNARVILCKKPKNHEALSLYPWFDGAWQ